MTNITTTPNVPLNSTRKDLYKDTPVRFLGFSNELGTAFSDLCKTSNVFVKNIPALSYVPSFGYIAADTFDKYKKGEDGTSEKPSIKMGARELAYQCITSVLAPTGVIIGTKKAAKTAAKKIGPKLPEKVQNIGKSADNFLKSNKVTGKMFSKPGMTGKVALVAVSLASLVALSKPIDKAADCLFEKFVDPMLGIKKKEQNNNVEIILVQQDEITED